MENAFPVATDGEIFCLLDDKTAFTNESTRADVEDLDAHFERIVVEGHHVGIGAIPEDDSIALHRPGQRAHAIPPSTSLLVVLALGGLLHRRAHVLDEGVRLPSEEATHVVHALPILLFVYATHTWRRALIDIAE